MFGFLPLALVFLLVSPADRIQLRKPGFWVWIVGSLLFLVPVLVWNMHHDWITAQHTSGHFTSSPVGILKRLSRFGEFLAGVFGGGTPVTMALFAAVLVLAAYGFRRIDRARVTCSVSAACRWPASWAWHWCSASSRIGRRDSFRRVWSWCAAGRWDKLPACGL